MTNAEFIKSLTVGTKLKIVHTCVRDSVFGMKKGQSYTDEGKVHSIKRVRRQWEESDKRIVLAVKGGYIELSVNALKAATLEEMKGFVRIVYADTCSVNSDIYHDFYIE